MHPIKFTSQHGVSDEWIVAEHITDFSRSSSLTVIYLAHGKYVFVRETPEEVARRIKEAVTPPARAKASLLSCLTFGAFA